MNFEQNLTELPKTDIYDLLDYVKDDIDNLPVSPKRRGNNIINIINIPNAFDIETTNTYVGEQKFACMYIWQLGINGLCVTGRTWDEFIQAINAIAEAMHLSANRQLYIYVYNLNFEFQFIRKRFRWSDVFATDDHSVIYATTDNYVSFRDCAILCGCNLETASKNLVKYKMPKLVGDLDYSKIRNSVTPMTPTEMGYCTGDIKSVMCIIQEKIEQSGGIANIPNTNTGYVRQKLREVVKACPQDYKRIQRMHMTLDDYTMCREAFMGGFTHASANWVGYVVNAKSKDKVSAYPTQCIKNKFPNGSGTWMVAHTVRDYEQLNARFGTIATITFVNISERVPYDHILSFSHCQFRFGDTPQLDNGRVVSAKRLTTTITNVDFDCIKRFYKWDRIIIKRHSVLCYVMDYLPKSYVNTILDFYENKTTLKDVAGSEVEYQVNKGMLNSLYGMMVEDPVRDQIVYADDTYTPKPVDISTAINRYNYNRNRVTFYPWGLFVTAYQRRELLTAIVDELKDDYMYTDTDSLKYDYSDNDHEEYFVRMGAENTAELERALRHHGISAERLRPKNSKGTPCPLGVWDDDGKFKFKTLGAKRYITQTEGGLSITIAGLGKKTGGKYIASKPDPFAFFKDGMYIPPEHTGKLTHTYVDYPVTAYIVDYMGNGCEMSELSFSHLEPCHFELGLADDFVSFLEFLTSKKDLG